MRAVVDTHKQTSQKLPEVTVVVAKGEEDITIRVSDEGGGIPRSQMTTMFCFLHTTAEHPETQSSERMFGNPGQMRATSQNTPVLAGWGVGLPLSRCSSCHCSLTRDRDRLAELMLDTLGEI